MAHSMKPPELARQCKALRFLDTHTIRIPWPVTMVPYGKRPKPLPVVLSRHANRKKGKVHIKHFGKMLSFSIRSIRLLTLSIFPWLSVGRTLSIEPVFILH